jgi:transcriptional regulator with XRE-family HTH domain
MESTAMTDRAILRELGRRIQRHRLDREITQQEVAERSGLTQATVARLEGGHPATLLTLLKVLRVLDLLGALDRFLPEPDLRPIALADRAGRRRQRASGRHSGARARAEE